MTEFELEIFKKLKKFCGATSDNCVIVPVPIDINEVCASIAFYNKKGQVFHLLYPLGFTRKDALKALDNLGIFPFVNTKKKKRRKNAKKTKPKKVH